MDTPQKKQKTVKLTIQSPNQQQTIMHKSSADSMSSNDKPSSSRKASTDALGHSELELSHVDLESSYHETSALKADSPVHMNKEAKYLHKKNDIKLTRSCVRFFTDGCLSLLLCLLMYTVFIHLSDAFWLYSNRVELAKRFEVKSAEKAQELTPDADFAVILITQGRNDYEKSMPHWLNVPTPDSKGQFMIIDFESEVPIKSNIPGLHVVRKDPLAPNVHTKFSKWEGLAIALNYIKAKKVFYFDACTYPKEDFRFEKYLKQDNINFFFVNDDRPMSGSFLADREDIVKFLSEIPLHIATDYRSFFGEDWMIDWYFNGRKADDWLSHFTHPSTQNFSEFAPDSIVAVRMMINMNRYAKLVDVEKNGQIEGRCHGGLSIFSCSIWGKVLALPGVWHIIDAVLSMDFLFKLIGLIFNRLFDWSQTVVVLVVGIMLTWCTLTYFAKKVIGLLCKNCILARYRKPTYTKSMSV